MLHDRSTELEPLISSKVYCGKKTTINISSPPALDVFVAWLSAKIVPNFAISHIGRHHANPDTQPSASTASQTDIARPEIRNREPLGTSPFDVRLCFAQRIQHGRSRSTQILRLLLPFGTATAFVQGSAVWLSRECPRLGLIYLAQRAPSPHPASLIDHQTGIPSHR